ncbi:hypothetical protein ACC676_39390, partial [Rhizobium ruizarguesonis]
NPEMMERLEGITIERLTDLSGRLFYDTVPTLSAIGTGTEKPILASITPGRTDVGSEACLKRLRRRHRKRGSDVFHRREL